MRTLALTLFFCLGLINLGCGAPAKKCSPSTCIGCCDATGECQGGSSNLACGVSGGQCSQCALDSVCQFGVCLTNSSGGGTGGTGGGTTGGGGACTGCIEMGACVPVSSQSTAACGLGANACGVCSAGQDCVNGTCVTNSNTCLEVSPFDLDFGPTQASCNSYRTVTLTNRCTAALTVNSLALPLSEFYFPTPVTLPVTLLANQILLFGLRMSPSSTGPRVGSLVVTWAVGVSLYQSTLGLFGTGSSGATVTESYAVPTTADILLVVDDSASMTDKQNSFSTNMAGFLATE